MFIKKKCSNLINKPAKEAIKKHRKLVLQNISKNQKAKVSDLVEKVSGPIQESTKKLNSRRKNTEE